jgi:hypothetical protein
MQCCALCTLCVRLLVCGRNEFSNPLKPMSPVCFCHRSPLQVAGCRSILNCVLALCPLSVCSQISRTVRLRDFLGLAHKLTVCDFWGNISCIVGNKVLLVLQGVVTM